MVVTDHDASLPSGCRPVEVARVLIARDPRLTEVIVGYANGLGQLEFRLGGNLVGKGAIDCEQRRIVAWGAGASHELSAAPQCKRPAYARDAVLACVRHWR